MVLGGVRNRLTIIIEVITSTLPTAVNKHNIDSKIAVEIVRVISKTSLQFSSFEEFVVELSLRPTREIIAIFLIWKLLKTNCKIALIFQFFCNL